MKSTITIKKIKDRIALVGQTTLWGFRTWSEAREFFKKFLQDNEKLQM